VGGLGGWKWEVGSGKFGSRKWEVWKLEAGGLEVGSGRFGSWKREV
jgi:hypothetical protein